MLFATGTLATLGLAAAALALIAWLGDRRRLRRRDIDAIGWVPWTPVFFLALMAACVALGLAVRAWLAV